MKILYLSTCYSSSSSKKNIYSDLIDSLVAIDNEVTVVTTNSSFGENNTIKADNLIVLEMNSPSYYNTSLFKKGLAFLKIPNLVIKIVKRQLSKKHFDLILMETPPSSLFKAAIWCKNYFNAPIYLLQKDIFPQNSVDLGIFKKASLTYLYFRKCEIKMLHGSDFIGVMSKKNKEYLVEYNKELYDRKIEYFPNSVLPEIIKETHTASKQIESTELNGCRFIFGGNMGKPQYIPLLVNAILSFKNRNDVSFVFVGRGTEKHLLEEAIVKHEIKNAIVLNNLNSTEYRDVLNKCDVGLIVLNPKFTIPNFPSRVLSYMIAKKPVIAATDINTDFKDLIERDSNNGIWVCSDDFVAFNEAIEKMISLSSAERTRLGESGYEYLINNFDVRKYINQLEKVGSLDSKCSLIYNKKILKKCAKIHHSSFKGHFLSNCGIHFLYRMYELYSYSDKAGVLAYFDNNEVVGSLLFELSSIKVYKKLLFKYPFAFIFGSIRSFFVNPALFFKTLKLLFKQEKSGINNDNCYVQSICISPRFQGHGTGGLLMNNAEKIAKWYNKKYIILETDQNSESNNRFYQKNGFILSSSYMKQKGRKMNIYKKEIK